MVLRSWVDTYKIRQAKAAMATHPPPSPIVASASFALLLRRHRRLAGLTQERLAEAAGVSVRSIRDMERGVARVPHRDTIDLLADSLALSPEEKAAFAAAARRHSTHAHARVAYDISSQPPLVGRAQEVALLERHLAGTGPPVLVLAGEPGIGKSRLLQEALAQASHREHVVLWGSCTRRAAQEPYAPLVQALHEHIHAQPPGRRRAALRGCAWLARLLPELASGPIEPLPAAALRPDQERRLMFAAVECFLRNTAGPAGVLLLLDDLQWAGPDALALLAALAHLAHALPLRVVGAYRTTEITPQAPISLLLGELAEASLVRQVTLGPLSSAEAGDLLDRLLGETAVRDPTHRTRVLARTGGVPFFLVSYAGEISQQSAGIAAGEVPWNVVQSVRRRLAALPESAQALVRTTAVIGRTVPYWLLRAVLAQPDDMIVHALEAACQVGLIVQAPDAAYSFAHDVIREVAEAELSSARRRLLHLRIAAALQGQPDAAATGALGQEPFLMGSTTPASVTVLAYHFQQGEDWDQALAYLVQAGDEAAAAYAHQDALNFYAQALAVSEKLGGAALPTVVAVYQKRGDLHQLLQRVQDAISDYDRMVVAARRMGDRRLEGLALAYRGKAEEDHHEFEQAASTLRVALAVADEGYDDVRMLATWLLAHTHAVVGRKAEAEALLRTTRDLARERGDLAMQQAFAGMLMLFDNWDGRYADALAAEVRLRGLVADSLADQTGVRWGMALLRGGMGDYQTALALLHEGHTMAERGGEVWARRRIVNTLGWLYGELQDHHQALEWNRQGVEAAQESLAPETNPECENNARLNLADSLLALGRLDEAETHFCRVEQVVRAPQPQDRYMLWRYAQHLFHSYGELWLLRGDAGRALAYADECLALAEPTTSRKNIVKGRRLRGQALIGQGRLLEAERELDIALQIAHQVGNPPQVWKTLVARGELRHAQRRLTEAHAEYQAALVVIDAVAADLTDASQRETFLASAHVQHIREAALAVMAENGPAVPTGSVEAPRTGSSEGVLRLQAGVPPSSGRSTAHGPGAMASARRASRSERQAWVLIHLNSAGAISPRMYAKAMAVSVDTALLDLRELMARGLVRAEGTTRDRRYRLRVDRA
jgi:tetratricopeptide (TPR) repeat protein/transcriptional regulator with XRE-family HTH domain